MRSSAIPNFVWIVLTGCNSVLGLETRPARSDGGNGSATTDGGGGTPVTNGAPTSSGNGGDGGNASGGVGDCMLDAGEECDDCNTTGGDGCDESGLIEPGWICDVVGDHCLRLSGLTTTPGETTVEAGGNGGGAFNHECGAGRLFVGVEAERTTESGEPWIGELRGRCAVIRVDVDRFVWDQVDVTTPPQGEEPNGALGTIDCPMPSVVTGLHPRSSGTLPGYKHLCSELTFADGQIRTASNTESAVIGFGPLDPMPRMCPPNTAASAFTGRSGALIDRLIIRCDTLAPTFCGDGQLDMPFEGCDDGNVASGDGCDSFCVVE